ncbi:UNVERIFIED_CONTAM: hypothetical protein HDU68_004631 [Siphonaria sp. JEL0065]|nr:hypothetical protein HDU68_004631 [Siphonaria sp. JEL0065]
MKHLILSYSIAVVISILSSTVIADFAELSNVRNGQSSVAASSVENKSTGSNYGTGSDSGSSPKLSGLVAVATKACTYGEWACSKDVTSVLQCNFVYDDNGGFTTSFAEVQSCSAPKTCFVNGPNHTAGCQDPAHPVVAASTKACTYGEWACSKDGTNVLQCNFVYDDNDGFTTAFTQVQNCPSPKTCFVNGPNQTAGCQDPANPVVGKLSKIEGSTQTDEAVIPKLSSYKAVALSAIVPDAANQTVPNALGEVYQDTLSRLTAYSGIFGGILIATGIAMAFFGHKLFKSILFLGGFYLFAAIAFVIMQNVEYNSPNSIGGDNRDLVYFAVCILVGALGGALMLFVWKLGFFAVGAGLGYVLAILVLTALHQVITSSTVQYAVIAVFVIAFGVLIFFLEQPVLIGSTAIGGSYAVFTGIDVFAQTGFTDAARSIVSGRGSLGEVNAGTKWVYMFVGCVILAIGGIVFQLYQVKQNKGNHEGLLKRNISKAENGTSKTAVSYKPYTKLPESTA